MKHLKKTLIGIFLVTIIAMSIGPFIWVLISSFKGNADILSSTSGFKNGLKLSNYITAFKIAPLGRFYINSIVVAIGSTILNLVTVSMAAYVIARHNFKGKKFFKIMFSLALLIPSAALLQPLYLTVNKTGLYDTLTGLIIVYAGFGLPTTLFIMMSYFRTIPKELEESAYLDGAGFFKTFSSVILPVAKPAFATAGVLQFLLAWNEFQFALTLTTGNENRTLPLALYYFKSAFASDYGAMFAAVVLVTIPSILVYITLQEQVVSGLSAGAVKG
ncbi:carbohydrate ABC transporter membrane protein 2, CUT1 family [Clostridium cavendishii DSM 21758]|uniref:Carbohydrate ABC transporter membrane protein 2, CUT1 family n=1 Tax=Clostridium cavendishii DSM 21758 TaxID=1121302 RepID=A0A1M6GVX4_9CLOT|nr:carbohydrate ABC transporter permease [Clostridium cavendishii]SHJ14045.1 carbohydrate ABC transporter membrane protein 2, CUT1 family [Clostridium cavendishii DSM 21758]